MSEPIIEERYLAASARLEQLLSEARRRLSTEIGLQPLVDFVAMRALARDVENQITETLEVIDATPDSIADAQEVIALCEQTLGTTAESIQASLRASADTAMV